MSTVLKFQKPEPSLVDRGEISRIVNRFGPARGEEVILQVVEHLGRSMHALDRAVRDQAFLSASRLAEKAGKHGAILGLATFCDVLDHLHDACRNGDAIAMSAILRRAQRLGDASLADMWDLPELRL